MEHRPFGWRQLLGAVNLRDFAQMVGGEMAQIGSSARLAVESIPHMPLGPLVFLGATLLLLFRALLLLLVVVFFGAGIALITLVRAALRLATGGPRSGDGG